MKRMKKMRVFSVILIASFLLALFLPIKGATATTLQEDYNRRNSLQSEINSIKKQRESISGELSSLRQDYSARKRVVELLYQEIASYQSELNVLADLIAEYNALVENKKAQIEELNAKIEHNYELFKERLVFAQESGTMSYIDFILGSSDLSDIMTRSEVINDMLEYDRQIIKEIGTSRDEVIRSKQEVEEALAASEERKAEYDAIMETLNQKMAEAQKYVDEIKDDVERTEAQNAALLAQQSAREAELQKLEKEIAEKQKNSAAYTGTFIWPLPSWFPGWISQYFHSGHSGVDIHVGGWGNNGKIPAIASAAGTVVRTGSYWDWGNLVVVDHGGGYQTYYAHLYRIDVSVGQSVLQGQQVGLIGSTGRSTGPHLHIVFVVNGVRVDPMKYIQHP